MQVPGMVTACYFDLMQSLRQYCLRNLPSSELQIPLLLCHPPAAIRWAASRVLAAGR